MTDDLVDVGWAVLVKAIKELEPEERAEVEAKLAEKQLGYIRDVIECLKGPHDLEEWFFEDLWCIGITEDLKTSIAADTLVSLVN